MKKRDKDILEQISKNLEQLNEQNELPQELSTKNIEKMLENVEVIKPDIKVIKPNNTRKKRALILVAAAFVMVLGVTIFSNVLNNRIPTEQVNMNQSNKLENAKSYQSIETMFLQMQKKAEQENRKFSFDKIADGLNNLKSNSTLDENETANQSMQESSSSQKDQQDFSQTNNQVNGVDEADIIKNDGNYLYAVQQSGSAITIINAKSGDKMSVCSTIIPKKDCKISNIYIYKDMLVAICQDFTDSNNSLLRQSGKAEYDCCYPQSSKTQVVFYDITEKTKPKQIKSFSQDGNCVTSRIINDKFYIVSNYGVNLVQPKEDLKQNCVPTISIDNGKPQRLEASDISVFPKNETPQYLVVCGIDLSNLSNEPSKKAILGGSSDAYCTLDSLYAARTVYKDSTSFTDSISSRNEASCKTEIYRFALNDGKVEFNQKGEVDGYFLNQFSMDEHNGYFRVATTQADDSQGSNVFVLNDKLEVVGSITGIAKNERIYAVRFIGEKGYVVTFEQTDPLFVIDLSDPKSPKITGELKIPGFSNYLHSYSENLLIGIGRHGNKNGALEAIKISLFDISDPNRPKEVDSYVVNNASSQVQYDAKAFLTSGKNGFFGIPISIYTSKGECEFRFDLFTVEDGKIKLKGKYINYEESEVKGNYQGFMQVQRGAYIGDTLYVISDSRIKAFSMQNNEQVGIINIDVINN